MFQIFEITVFFSFLKSVEELFDPYAIVPLIFAVLLPEVILIAVLLVPDQVVVDVYPVGGELL